MSYILCLFFLISNVRETIAALIKGDVFQTDVLLQPRFAAPLQDGRDELEEVKDPLFGNCVALVVILIVLSYLGDGEKDGVAVSRRRQPYVQSLIQATRSEHGRVDDVWEEMRK